MRLSRLVGLCLLSTAALAGPTRPATWAVEYSSADGKYFGRDLSFFTKEECEAAIPRVLKEWPGYQPAHCIEWKNGQFIGSWDPQLAEGSWAMEFTTGMGNTARLLVTPRKSLVRLQSPRCCGMRPVATGIVSSGKTATTWDLTTPLGPGSNNERGV